MQNQEKISGAYNKVSWGFSTIALCCLLATVVLFSKRSEATPLLANITIVLCMAAHTTNELKEKKLKKLDSQRTGHQPL